MGVDHHPCAPRSFIGALEGGALLLAAAGVGVHAEAAESAATGVVVEAEASLLFLAGGCGALGGGAFGGLVHGRRVLAQQQQPQQGHAQQHHAQLAGLGRHGPLRTRARSDWESAVYLDGSRLCYGGDGGCSWRLL